MTSHNNNKKQEIEAWIIGSLLILFILYDATIKLLKPVEVITSALNILGYAEHPIFIQSLLALTATIFYTITRTSISGAILLTAHLAIAIASHLKIDHPIYSNLLFTFHVGFFIWSGLWLRNIYLKKLLPFVTN